MNDHVAEPFRSALNSLARVAPGGEAMILGNRLVNVVLGVMLSEGAPVALQARVAGAMHAALAPTAVAPPVPGPPPSDERAPQAGGSHGDHPSLSREGAIGDSHPLPVSPPPSGGGGVDADDGSGGK